MENNEYEIDLGKILEAIKKVLIPCIIFCIVSTTVAFIFTITLIKPSYTSTGKIIVVQKNDSKNNQLNFSDVQLSQKLVSTYNEILKSERICDLVLKELNLNYTFKQYNSMLKVTSAANTEVINVIVESDNPKEATILANTIIEVFQKEIYNIMNIENVSVLSWAKVPTQKSSPSIVTNSAFGLLIGIMLSGLLVVYTMIKDNNVRTEEQFREIFQAPIIGIIPELEYDFKRGGK